MEHNDKKLGLASVVSISVGLIVATSCLVSLGQGAGEVGVVFIGAMVIACLLNMTTVAGTVYACRNGTISHFDIYGRRLSDL